MLLQGSGNNGLFGKLGNYGWSWVAMAFIEEHFTSDVELQHPENLVANWIARYSALNLSK